MLALALPLTLPLAPAHTAMLLTISPSYTEQKCERKYERKRDREKREREGERECGRGRTGACTSAGFSAEAWALDTGTHTSAHAFPKVFLEESVRGSVCQRSACGNISDVSGFC